MTNNITKVSAFNVAASMGVSLTELCGSLGVSDRHFDNMVRPDKLEATPHNLDIFKLICLGFACDGVDIDTVEIAAERVRSKALAEFKTGLRKALKDMT